MDDKKFLPELLNFSRAKRSLVPMAPDDFRKIRKAAGMTQGEMAKRIGVTRLTICNWEGAKFRIPDDILDTLAAKGIGQADQAKPKLSPEDRGTLQAYSKMRRSGDPIFSHHAHIVTAWHNAGFTPSREAMAAIAAEWPDILGDPNAPQS